MRRRRYTMIELAGALVIFTILANAALSTAWALKRAHRQASLRSHALLVLDNTLTRLAAEPALTPARVTATWHAELAASPLADQLTAHALPTPAGGLRLELRGTTGYLLAHLELPPCAAPTP